VALPEYSTGSLLWAGFFMLYGIDDEEKMAVSIDWGWMTLLRLYQYVKNHDSGV